MSVRKKSQSIPQLVGKGGGGHHSENQQRHAEDSSLQVALDDAVKFAATYRKGRDMSRDQSDLRQVWVAARVGHIPQRLLKHLLFQFRINNDHVLLYLFLFLYVALNRRKKSKDCKMI